MGGVLLRLAVMIQFCIVPPPRVLLPGPVVRPFVAPACARCAGHRGVTVSVTGPVSALLPGVVTFDGTVGRHRYLVIASGADLRLTYGDITGRNREEGTVVAAGEVLGSATGLLYVGVRMNGQPVDPRLVLGRGSARLVPPTALACPEPPMWAPIPPR